MDNTKNGHLRVLPLLGQDGENVPEATGTNASRSSHDTSASAANHMVHDLEDMEEAFALDEGLSPEDMHRLGLRWLRYQALKGEPPQDLKGLLSKCGISQLQIMARALRVSGRGAMRKAQLAEVVHERIISMDFEEWLLSIHPDDWEYFLRHMELERLEIPEDSLTSFYPRAIYSALIFLFYDKERQTYITLLPEEIGRKFAQMSTRAMINLKRDKALQELVISYAEQLTDLYDVISWDGLCGIMAACGDLDLRDIDLLDKARYLLRVIQPEDSIYIYAGDMLIDGDRFDAAREDLPSWDRTLDMFRDVYAAHRLLMPGNMPQSREALMDAFAYQCDQRHLDRYEAALAAFAPGAKAVRRLGHLVDEFVQTRDEDEALQCADKVLNSLPKASEMALAQELVDSLCAVRNHSRMPENANLSPAELAAYVGKLEHGSRDDRLRAASIREIPWLYWPLVINLQHNTPYTAPDKPGRNSPCPCGSGRKYKHCCGRKG